MAELRASGTLRWNGPGTWTTLALDRTTSALLGRRGKVPVRGTLNGAPFESTAIPNGDGTHSLLVTRPIQLAAAVRPGDRVEARFAPVAKRAFPRVPTPLAAALRHDPVARKQFDARAPSPPSAWIEYVSAAKQPVTQGRRAQRTVALLAEGTRRPGERARASGGKP
ncbi:MAG: YdeI/OmpD-associated family protein [Thermoplasmata archaeon]|nr:YdeI/OmpD-associated family protein [Thermoplasmata archaeon]MCI4356103.1 YdeI/OmpD-associated family protein [Thermoplasmata archaeon]